MAVFRKRDGSIMTKEDVKRLCEEQEELSKAVEKREEERKLWAWKMQSPARVDREWKELKAWLKKGD